MTSACEGPDRHAHTVAMSDERPESAGGGRTPHGRDTSSASGTLFVVATPIGNLEDITLRALRVLREAAVVAAEDTRRTAGLLEHFGIRAPLLSFHAHNEHQRTPGLLETLRTRGHVALVTDAGTPLISDPGLALVRAARLAGLRVEAVPGPSAVLAALVASGLPSATFSFVGFPPARAAERLRWLTALVSESRTAVLFEAPHRIVATLKDLAVVMPDRNLALCRELTKLHEEVLTGTAAQVLAQLRHPRGEVTLVIAPPPEAPPTYAPDDAVLWREFCSLTGPSGLARRAAVAALARRYGQSSRAIYAALERAKDAGGSGG
jgi:16S rRNA (cytidine1402-2'-O)-methyltransferase